MGVNQFTDLSEAEFAALYLTLKVPQDREVQVASEPQLLGPQPGELDWAVLGKVTNVKDQGSCGSCWAFAVTGALESAYLIKQGRTEQLAEQDLVDCSGEYGNMGCNGGSISAAYNYILSKGIAIERDYPYAAKDGVCNKTAKRSVSFNAYLDLTSPCEGLKSDLQGRPVSAAVDASNWSTYKSGILSECGTTINHAVLVVGVNNDYWRVKNSWGTTWGEAGFIRLAPGNTCSVCSLHSYPLI
jgi:C1A family cysteine protease